MTLNGALLTGINDKAVENAEQDQTARMCRVIFVYTLCEINLWSPMSKTVFQPTEISVWSPMSKIVFQPTEISVWSPMSKIVF